MAANETPSVADLSSALEQVAISKILQVLQENYLQDLHISCKMAFTGILS